MAFELKEKDMLARIGKLETKSGTIETPLLFPVINPALQLIPPKRLHEEFGFQAVITNAYILKTHFGNRLMDNELHEFLDFNGPIMTDSGAYQILVYGSVGVEPSEVVTYQEQIGSDIATILDIPTGWKAKETLAEQTVNETLRRAKELFRVKTCDDILWVGPVQGGRHLNLVAKSAVEMAKLPFQIHALGSPTEVMQGYHFDVLVDMIMAAKTNLPVDRPLHLFGAGHPFMFSLAVALGCDLFDSAAYALYAREDRYMTESGTERLNELEYFPCSCPRCTKATPKGINELPKNEKQTFLAEHNLYACAAEIRRIKQAIKHGRLWEHLETRAHSHPALLQALNRLRKYEDFIEKHDPATKKSGLFFFSSIGLGRPEVVRYRRKLKKDHTSPKKARSLILIPQTRNKPFHKSREYRRVRRAFKLESKEDSSETQACFYAAPFGVVPLELDEVFPLSQHETSMPLDLETIAYVAREVADYINRTGFEEVILLDDAKNWGSTILYTCRKVCRRKQIKFRSYNAKSIDSTELSD